jgi:putative hydrolase of the HAD superfamily
MLPWKSIEKVFLDLDGTLLDLHFDNHFWLEHVPLRYAQKHGLDLVAAKAMLYERYRQAEGTLDWYCIDYWTRELELDIAVLKEEVDHLIAVHPYVIDFLDAVRRLEKRLVLVTNAHMKSLALKLDRTRLGGHFDAVVCAHDLGLPKEDPSFWGRLHTIEPFDPARTLFVDDNVSVLRSAQSYGIAHLVVVTRPDSRKPAKRSDGFPAIASFRELTPAQ